jgi:hypothetical protein
MLPESSSSQRTLAQQLPYVNDPYIIDIVKVTEDRVAELELELQEQKKYTDEVETKLANLKYQVKNEQSLEQIIIKDKTRFFILRNHLLTYIISNKEKIFR